MGSYQNQIDDDEAEGGQAMEMSGARPNGNGGIYSARVGMSSVERTSARGSTSLFRSDIDSDFVINNAYTVQNDLEAVNLIQNGDTNGFIRRVYVIFTGQMLFSTALVGACAEIPGLIALQTENFFLFWVALGVYAICDLLLIC